MIEFNDLNINKDSTLLTIDAKVKSDIYYENVYIDKVVIDSDKTFSQAGYSSSPVYEQILTGSQKTVHLELTNQDILGGLQGRLMFVYIVTKGAPSPDTPCGKDNITTLGAVANMYPLYQQSISTMKELKDTCSIPKAFIDSLLRQKAVELSIRTGHYIEAIYNWGIFFNSNSSVLGTKLCNCNGNFS